MSSNTLRVFFAVVPPREVHDSLSRLLRILKKRIYSHSIRWMHVEHLHVTLQFLGELQKEHLISLTELVRTQLKNIPSFQLQLGHLTIFPTKENPGIISLTVEPHSLLATLSSAIGQAMNVLGYPVESRPFQAHMTLGRIHQEKLQTEFFSCFDLPNIQPTLIREVYLIESRPGQEGSNYVPLAQFKLK